MQLDNIRVPRKLWGMFLVLMLAMLVISGFQQYRANNSMARAIEQVIAIEGRISKAIRWRGATETAVTMVMGGAVTTDAVLAQQYDARIKAIIADINKIQQEIINQAQDPEEKAALDKVQAERKLTLAATAKTWELKGAGDAVETQRFADEQLTPTIAKYLKAQDEFVGVLEKRREAIVADAQSHNTAYAVQGLAASLVLMGGFLFLAWKLVRSITVPLDQAGELIDAIAAGDLTRELHAERKDEFGHMLRALSRMAERLRGVVGEVRTGVEAVSLASTEIATGNQDLSARTEQTASNLEQTASSMEELTATVTQSADTARQANQLAANAAQAATRGGQVVGQVVASMEQITHSSRKISDIISVIDGIAFQTNILALNAAVEAARAGEQGRGFAVVASEVRSLAGRSAEAAKEIKQLINASVENVETGSQQVAEAGQSMEEIVSSVQRVSDLIGEITASSSEQRDGIAQVNQAVTHLDQMTQQNAALVEQSTAAATSLRDQAQRLSEVVSVFNVGSMAVSRTPAPARAAAAASASPRVAPAPARAKSALPGAAKPARAPAAPQRIAAAPAPARSAGSKDGDWENF
ncbi:MAG: HAMP domain-containing protein [Burkholderiales bacterium]|nr:HAMP domain-containing protein [Burkholderiales bacterium]